MTITIVGAGLGGLPLARVLHVNGIGAVVYERESSRGSRGQGGVLDLHSGTGQRALREAGLIDQFHAISRREGQDLRLLEPDGTLLLQEDTPDDAPLERLGVDRADLRSLLLDSLPEHAVRWGRAFESADNGLLHFADGRSATYDLLVGADGADSRVRALLTDARPADTGHNVVELGIPDIDRTHPDLAAMIGHGNYWVLGNGQSLSAQRNGDGRVRIYLSFYNSAEDWFATSGIPFGDPAVARVRLIDLFTGWDSRFTALIAACDDTVLPRSMARKTSSPHSAWSSTPSCCGTPATSTPSSSACAAAASPCTTRTSPGCPRSGTRTSTASAATPSPPSRQQSYDRCATRTHAIARTAASSDVTVRGPACVRGSQTMPMSFGWIWGQEE
jgi:hypothetical protein